MKSMEEKQYYSTIEAAKLLGVSRVTVFKWIGKLKLKAKKIGRNYAIPAESLTPFLKSQQLTDESRATIDRAVKKTVTEYGETLRLLANG